MPRERRADYLFPMRTTKPTEYLTVFVVLPFARKPKYSTCGRSANLPIESSPMSAPPPAEALGRIFEPFYQVTEAREHQTGGTGLGLSIAQRIAIVHGGSIRAHNRGGGGLEIEIFLPAQNLVSAPPYAR
jgi:hypothetical protein